MGFWLPIAFLLPTLWRVASGVSAQLAAALALLGAVGLVITIGADMGETWLVAAAALVAAQIILIADGWRIAGQHSPTQN
jgi:hypothetical protein